MNGGERKAKVKHSKVKSGLQSSILNDHFKLLIQMQKCDFRFLTDYKFLMQGFGD